ncbi:MAG: hypothetical protein KBG48_17880 [Kofleriaceae bacterium]|nr:hypothetical protein [Kofleriaceae bacterium]MBP9169273.1 hypothetical protein [Kofleriaceae bacterium]MBP9859018.1 hypothetical protein [Kofleriaceae bacterium]
MSYCLRRVIVTTLLGATAPALAQPAPPTPTRAPDDVGKGSPPTDVDANSKPVVLTTEQLTKAVRLASDAGRQVATLEAKLKTLETREEDAKKAEAAPAQTKLAPTYPQFTTGGSAGLPWYSKGASLSVPFQLGQATDVDDASAEVRYTIDAFDGGFAVEKSTVTLLAAERGGAPVSASSAMFAMRVAFGSATKRAKEGQRVCTQDQAVAKDGDPCAQIKDGDYRIALGWSGSVGARAGAITIDDRASAAFAVEAVGEHTRAQWSAFASLSAEFYADNRGATRHYGGAGGQLTVGARFGNFNRVGVLARGGARTWSQGPDKDYHYDYTLDVMLFGVFEQVRLGAGITRALNASQDPEADAFVPTLWLSPQI